MASSKICVSINSFRLIGLLSGLAGIPSVWAHDLLPIHGHSGSIIHLPQGHLHDSLEFRLPASVATYHSRHEPGAILDDSQAYPNVGAALQYLHPWSDEFASELMGTLWVWNYRTETNAKNQNYTHFLLSGAFNTHFYPLEHNRRLLILQLSAGLTQYDFLNPISDQQLELQTHTRPEVKLGVSSRWTLEDVVSLEPYVAGLWVLPPLESTTPAIAANVGIEFGVRFYSLVLAGHQYSLDVRYGTQHQSSQSVNQDFSQLSFIFGFGFRV